ncbi:P-loop containing nucleoside triphosphate hydrolase protein [Lentinula raphanica]|nr:P-loop containing nucleoside triphosphate hydrolase protein [Lentinula raphanica]
MSTSASSTESPYRLSKLLRAGHIELELKSGDVTFDQNRAEDGWFLLENLLDGSVQTAFESLIISLRFLTRHRFAFATFNVDSSKPAQLVIRIYLIPYDLPGANGRLSYHARKHQDPQLLAAARRHMLNLLPCILQDQHSWDFGTVCSSSETRFLINHLQAEQRTLPEIYGKLPSPTAGSYSSPGSSSLISRLFNFQDTLEDFGLRSTLHHYQRESVAAMLEREEHRNANIANPLYIPLTTLDGMTFYYQPGTTEILKEQSIVSAPPGGILCEELGTGKTVMILALILATMKELSKPEDSVTDTRPVLTPLAFRHFPSGEFAATRNRFPLKSRLAATSSHPRVPSLQELSLHRLCCNPDSQVLDVTTPKTSAQTARWSCLSEMLERASLDSLRRLNHPFYYHFEDALTDLRTTDRGRRDPGPRLMYLSVATLIVVPQNLVSQWDREIHKHCKETPRLLIIRSKTVLPSAKILAMDYDIILITYSRFCDEDRKANVANARSWKICKCPELAGSRVPDCNCKPPDISPLLQIRWKRLVIDEGHISSSLSTRLTPFARLLSVQAKWIVSGTPTTHLLGLSLGERETETSAEDQMESLALDHSQQVSREITSSDQAIDNSSRDASAQIWNDSHIRFDIGKLVNMVSQFIGAKFLTDGQVIRTHIKDALFTEKGPLPGGIDMLMNLMTTTMIRHLVTDVEKEISLPKLTQETVLLDLDPLMILSYNALQASISINAIDSERTDQDYLFHPSNAELLQLLVKNMSQLMFWSVDSKLYNVEELAKNTEELLTKVEEGKKTISGHDIAQAQKSLKHIRLACQNDFWRQTQMHEDIPYLVSDVPSTILKEWSPLPNQFIHSDRLLRLREQVIRYPLTSGDALCSLGQEVSRVNLQHRLIITEMEQKKGKSKGNEKTKQASSIISAGTNNLKARSGKVATSNDRIREMQNELRDSLARLAALEGHEESPVSGLKIRIPPRPDPNCVLLRQSPIALARVRGTASSKLNYILEEVQKYSAEEKFLIFSESPLTLSHVYEALTLMQVKSLQFTTQTSPLVREQLVLTFETSATYRVFLMELKHGARGLNLVSASRVIFCEPVWQADVESQAIKRAHRIGQVRPVSVKTLVIRGTAEEKMLEQRQALNSNTSGKVPKLLEEAGMRHYIAHPEFIETSGLPGPITPHVDFPLFHLPHDHQMGSPPLHSSSIHKRVRLEDPVMSSDISRPKKRFVQFV